MAFVSRAERKVELNHATTKHYENVGPGAYLDQG